MKLTKEIYLNDKLLVEFFMKRHGDKINHLDKISEKGVVVLRFEEIKYSIEEIIQYSKSYSKELGRPALVVYANLIIIIDKDDNTSEIIDSLVKNSSSQDITIDENGNFSIVLSEPNFDN